MIHYSVGSGYYFTMKGPMALDQEFIDKEIPLLQNINNLKFKQPSFPFQKTVSQLTVPKPLLVNHRQKKMGYNVAQELYRRVQENITKGHDDDD